MVDQKTGFGLIGTGAVSGHYAAAINELDHAELVAVSSSNPERKTIAQERFQVTAYSNYHDLVNRSDIHVVCILTESGNHLEPALLAAGSGKHVLCEKPLEVTLERADRMIEACRKAKVKLGCIFQNRFKPDYQKLKESVNRGELGRLLCGNAYIKWFRNDNYYTESHWHGKLHGDGGGALVPS